jgi:hypothetical protein
MPLKQSETCWNADVETVDRSLEEVEGGEAEMIGRRQGKTDRQADRHKGIVNDSKL